MPWASTVSVTTGMLFSVITPKRWELIEHLQKIGPSSIRGLARSVERDIKRVHDDVSALSDWGIIERAEDGKVWKIDPSELARCYKPRMVGNDFAMANIGEMGSNSSPLPWQNNQLDELKALLFEAEKARAIAEVRAEAAERIAEERGRHLDDLRRLLLTKKQTSEPGIGPSLSGHTESTEPRPALAFWRRLFDG